VLYVDVLTGTSVFGYGKLMYIEISTKVLRTTHEKAKDKERQYQ
jgi:hypothetical protein